MKFLEQVRAMVDAAAESLDGCLGSQVCLDDQLREFRPMLEALERSAASDDAEPFLYAAVVSGQAMETGTLRKCQEYVDAWNDTCSPDSPHAALHALVLTNQPLVDRAELAELKLEQAKQLIDRAQRYLLDIERGRNLRAALGKWLAEQA